MLGVGQKGITVRAVSQMKKNMDLNGAPPCFPVYFVLDMFIIKNQKSAFTFIIFKLR